MFLKTHSWFVSAVCCIFVFVIFFEFFPVANARAISNTFSNFSRFSSFSFLFIIFFLSFFPVSYHRSFHPFFSFLSHPSLFLSSISPLLFALSLSFSLSLLLSLSFLPRTCTDFKKFPPRMAVEKISVEEIEELDRRNFPRAL